MASVAVVSWRAAVLARWIARVSGGLLFLFFLALVIGEGPPPLLAMGPHERAFWFGLLALFAGLALAWIWEGWGAILTLAGWVFLCVLARRLPAGALFLVPAAIALLHLLCWLRLRLPAPAMAPAPAAVRIAARVAWALAAVFALLCANEIFGNPPLMTPALRPNSNLAGRWQSTPGSPLSAALEIHSDGRVTGAVADIPLVDARFANNRTWFGRLMHWRNEYSLEARGIHAGFTLRNGRLEGAVQEAHGPYGLTLAAQR